MTRKSALSRAELDDLLDGRSTSDAPLGALIKAAAAPGAAHEIGALPAALAAFDASPVGYHPHVSRKKKTMIGSALANVLAAKVLAASAAAAAVGGVALAAATGHLSSLPSHPGGTPSASQAQHSNASTNAPSGLHSTTPPVTRGSGQSSTHPSASPSPSLYGLCQAWVSGAGTAGHAASNPAFTALITAAGGADAVDSYCAGVLAAPRPSDGSSETGTPPTAAPGNPTHPTGPPSSHGNSTHPTGPPSTHPGGAPSTHPTGAPSTHPTGAPNTHPGNTHS